jgi:hypothetical protein
VVQDAAAVAVWDQGAGTLRGVDLATMTAPDDRRAAVPGGDEVQLGGGTLATLDPATGALRAAVLGGTITSLAAVDAAAPKLGMVGAGAHLAVGHDGTVYAASTATRTLSTYRRSGAGFTAAATTPIELTGSALQLTAVGAEPVLFDPQHGTVQLADGRTTLAQGSANGQLQQPGPAADSVLIGAPAALYQVPLDGGMPRALATSQRGTPIAPVFLGGCAFEVWGGAASQYAQRCGGGGTGVAAKFAGAQTAQDLVFRVNRGQIKLNNRLAGLVWSVDDKAHQLNDPWSAVKPPPRANPKKNNKPSPESATNKAALKAKQDDLGARPGRTTVLHVLDNDAGSTGEVLAITGLTKPDQAAAEVRIAPDQQSILIALPGTASAPVRFRYTVDDGRKLNSSAEVTVHPHRPDQNAPPALRRGATLPAATVASSGQVALPVTGEWRDPDGDPVLLTAARPAGATPAAAAGTADPGDASAGTTGTTVDGRILYDAPPTGGMRQLRYAVSDGIGRATEGTARITVLDPKSSALTAPKAEPDVVSAVAGRPVSVHPADNDMPGADPTADDPQLVLASAVAQPAGTQVRTDLVTGTVTITAQRPGTYWLPYSISYGAAVGRGQVRLNVEPAPATPKAPVTSPDSAALRGQQAVVVDVLANDYDPGGQVLAVTHAAAATSTGLRVAVIDGRFLRIEATTAAAQQGALPDLVGYTVTNGAASVSGEVGVARLPVSVRNTRPVPRADEADVRAGDTVSVAVLGNDLDQDGDPLRLTPGGVSTLSGTGSGYVAGDRVRYAAPAAVPDLAVMQLSYTVEDPSGATATGRLTIRVHPVSEQNLPPVPLPLTTSLTAGDTTALRLPTTGIDPNGDSVTVTGVASAPRLGRILAVGPDALTYQAFPTSAGTEEFRYQVIDRYGAVGVATIRLGVDPPAEPQPPVAVDDAAAARPGARLSVDVRANDLIARGAEATTTVGLRSPPAGVVLDGGVITLTAPPADGNPLVVQYALSDGLATSAATLTVRGIAGYNNPPVARDDDAKPAGPATRTAVVDVLGNDSDPDGTRADLKITVVGPGGALVGGKVSVTLRAQPQNIWYGIADRAGAKAVAVIRVPASGGGLPYVKPGALIRVDTGKSVTAPLGTYVVDPAGKPVRLTITRNIWPAPADGLTATSHGDNQLTLTGRGGYVGPAAVTFEATDGASLTDPAGQHAVLTIPVQVGPDTPVLRCPPSTFVVIEGGQPLAIPLLTVCHVWVPTAVRPADVAFTAAWADQPGGVTQRVDGQALRVQAGGSAQPGTGTITVGVAGSAQRQKLTIQVARPPLPTVRPIQVEGLRAGDSRTIDVAGYLNSPILDAKPVVVRAVSVTGVAVRASGSAVTLTPAGDARGEYMIPLTVADVGGRADREVPATISLRVLGIPATIGRPTADANRTAGHQAQVTWPAPAYDGGAAVDQYRVRWAGGSQQCAASPCVITGLTNGRPYTFTVAAHNVVGWSAAESPASNAATPDAKPGAVSGLRVASPVGDRRLALSWAANHPDGSPVDQYQLEISDLGTTSPGTRTVTVTGAQTAYAAAGLVNNDPYRFRIRAHNADGWGPYGGAVPGQPAGTPAAMGAPAVPAEQSTSPVDQTTASISWQPEPDPNGPPVRSYAVYRKTTGAYAKLPNCATVSANGTLSCLDTVGNDGTQYSYAVTATNGAGLESAPTNGTTFTATGRPDAISAVTAAASDNPGPGPQTDTGPGYDGAIHVRFTVPQPHGARISSVHYSVNGAAAGSWASPGAPGQQVTETIGGLSNGQSYAISLTACNEGNAGAENCADPSPDSNTVVPYGPPLTPTASATNNGTVVTYSWGDGTNGRTVVFYVDLDGTGYSERGTSGGSQQIDRGYAHNYSISVFVRDVANQQSATASANGSTPANPPTVTVSKGGACSAGTTCAQSGTCTNSSCAYIRVQTANFPGRVTCSFDSDHGNSGFVNSGYGANETRDSPDWYGFPGTNVYVTCGGVRGTFRWS